MEEFRAIGLSYKDTKIGIRELVALEGAIATDFLLKVREVCDVEEALLISTCNRTELYYSSKHELHDELIKLIASFKGISISLIKDHFTRYNSGEAVRHLFEVSLGLDSKVLGDIQISNQVKRAYQMSADLDLAGPYLHRLMHTIFFANKRVVQETTLQDGTASVASVAVDLIKGFIKNIQQPRLALIGIGEIGKTVLENLGDCDGNVTIVNRTRSKAEKLAEELGLEVKGFDELDEVIEQNDVIISAISTKEPIITSTNFPSTVLHKLLIDLSVPRAIDSSLDNLPGIALYNVDQLSEKTERARNIREKAIPDVERIIDESLAGFENWKHELEVSPTIKKLKSALDQIRQEELARYKKASDQEMELLEVVTKNMIQKLIKLPVLQLKAACKRGEADTLVDVLNDLFNLEQQEVEKK